MLVTTWGPTMKWSHPGAVVLKNSVDIGPSPCRGGETCKFFFGLQIESVASLCLNPVCPKTIEAPRPQHQKLDQSRGRLLLQPSHAEQTFRACFKDVNHILQVQNLKTFVFKHPTGRVVFLPLIHRVLWGMRQCYESPWTIHLSPCRTVDLDLDLCLFWGGFCPHPEAWRGTQNQRVYPWSCRCLRALALPYIDVTQMDPTLTDLFYIF